MKKIILLTLTLAASPSGATTIFTEFNTQDGFVTGFLGPSILSDSSGMPAVVFGGGQQQQGFFGPAYNQGPAAYIFNNGGFNGILSTGDTGLIGILGNGATQVSFHAADLGNGPATSFTAIGTDGSVLGTALTQVDTLGGDDPAEVIEFFASGSINIAAIEVNLPGPASNPPYAASIDSFSATLAVPEPSSVLLTALGLMAVASRRRR